MCRFKTIAYALTLVAATALSAQQADKPSSFDEWRKSRVNTYMNDFAELERYRSANTALQSVKPEIGRVVFSGTPSLTSGNLTRLSRKAIREPWHQRTNDSSNAYPLPPRCD